MVNLLLNLYNIRKVHRTMFSITELENYLKDNNSDYEILEHESPILSTQDAAKYFDIKKAAPTFIVDTEQGLVALIISSRRGKIDFKTMRQSLGFSKLKMADKEKVEKEIGYQTGTVPLIGHNLPCIFDNSLLENDYVFGGSGDVRHTLKIVPNDILRLNNVIKHIGVL